MLPVEIKGPRKGSTARVEDGALLVSTTPRPTDYNQGVTLSSAIAGTTLATAGVLYGLIGIQKGAGPAADLYVATIEGMVGSADYCKVELIKNPTYSSGTAFAYSSPAGARYSFAVANTGTPPIYTAGTGTVLAGTLFSQNMNNAKQVLNADSQLFLPSDTFVVAISGAFASANIKAIAMCDLRWY